MLRKISASLAVLMLLALSAPVLTYAASFLKVYYDASTGRISGVIYSDQKDISLSLENEDGSAVQVPSSVLGEVYQSYGLYWANVKGNIAPGLVPDSAAVTAGDTRNFAAGVTDNVYSFENTPAPPLMTRGYGTSYESNGTVSISVSWDNRNEIGISHYNVYNNDELVGTTKRTYFQIRNLPYHSIQNIKVNAVDILGRTSAYSNIYTMRTSGGMEEAEFLLSGKAGGAALQPSEEIAVFKLAGNVQLNQKNSWNSLNLFLGGVYSLNEYMAFTLNKSEITATDFELVSDDGEIIPVNYLQQYENSLYFNLSQNLKLDGRYTLRLSATASGKEILVPNANSAHITASLSADVFQSYDENGYYYYFYHASNIIVGDPYAPLKPTGLKASGNGSLTVTWDKNSESDLDGYLVWLDGKLLTDSPVKQNSYNINGLNNGQTYHVNVAAVDKVGNRSLQAFIFPGSASRGVERQQ